MAHPRGCILFASSLLVGGCVVFDAIGGSGKIVTEPRTVANFSTVKLSGSGQVDIEQTGSESLSVTTDDNLIQYIKTEVRGDTLELGFKDPMTNLRPTQDIIFKLTVKKLDGLEVSGSGKAIAQRLDGSQLHIRISGSGDVSLHGTSNDVDLEISGSGGYRGDDLKSRSARVRVSGSGSAVVNASDSLNASVSGSGAIDYIGSPQITQNISGSGSVQRR